MTRSRHSHVRACLVWAGAETVDRDVVQSTLSDFEHARAARFRFSRDAERWKRCRFWARAVLGRRLGIAPSAVEFAHDVYGKPRLAAFPRTIHFNISHSGEWLAVALSDEGEVGIDIERVRDDFPALEVAHHFFTPAERSAMEDGSPAAARSLFFQLWTGKEALMKATGLGVAMAPGTIDVSPGSAGPRGYVSHPEFSVSGLEWQPGLWAAVATASDSLTVRWRVISRPAGERARGSDPEISTELGANSLS